MNTALLLIICLLTTKIQTCSDNSACFVKKLFDFDFPA